jgi:type III restriction enzyme
VDPGLAVDLVHGIEAVAKIGDTLRVLDMTNPKVRDAVAKAADAKTLYESGIAGNY